MLQAHLLGIAINASYMCGNYCTNNGMHTSHKEGHCNYWLHLLRCSKCYGNYERNKCLLGAAQYKSWVRRLQRPQDYKTATKVSRTRWVEQDHKISIGTYPHTNSVRCNWWQWLDCTVTVGRWGSWQLACSWEEIDMWEREGREGAEAWRDMAETWLRCGKDISHRCVYTRV